MSQLPEWFASSLLRNSLTLIVAALIVATCVKWLRLRSPAGEQWAWLLVLTQGVMFVWLTVPVPREWLLHAPPPARPLFAPAEIDVPATNPEPQGVPLRLDVPRRDPFDPANRQMEVIAESETDTMTATVVSPPPFSSPTRRERLPAWPVILCLAWLTGVVFVVGIGIARYVAFVRRLRCALRAPSAWSDEWKESRAAAGINAVIPLVVSSDLGPALCRLPTRYELVVPKAAWARLSADERAAVYRHELEHYRRNDVWWMLLARFLACVHWFNPCAWWAARRYEAQSEFACDAAAAGDDPASFSELLVQLASNPSRRVSGIQSVAAGSVYERVQRLLSGEHGRQGWRAAAPIAVAAIAALSVRIEAVESRADVTGNNSTQPANVRSIEDMPESRVVLADAAENPQPTQSDTAEPAGPRPDVAADELTGVVVDADGLPIEGVLVDVWHWYAGNETRTDERGVFRIRRLDPKERVEVLITKDGYSPQHFPQQQVGAPGWTVVLSNKTYLEGVITGADGQPAVRAEIRAAFGPVEGHGFRISEVTTIGRTGLDGKYRLYLKPDTYDIQIAAPGQGVKRLASVVVPAEEATPRSVTLERGVRFAATVVDSETVRAPVEGFVLWQPKPPHLIGRSDAMGRLVFEDLVPGTIEFNCGGGEAKYHRLVQLFDHGPFGRWWSQQAKAEWHRKHIDDPATGWQRNFDSLTFDLHAGMSPVEIVVERAVRISGRVTDPDGNTVAGATVAPARTGSGNSLTGDTRYSVKTNADGTYQVLLPASNDAQYNLIVHDGEYQEWRNWANGVTPPMQTRPGQVIEGHDLQLTRPATVRGRVTFGGKPAAHRDVRTHAFDKLENRYYDPTTTTDDDGNFELKFVRPGKHDLQVEPFWLSAGDAPHGTRIIEVEAGQVLAGQDLVAAPPPGQPQPGLANQRKNEDRRETEDSNGEAPQPASAAADPIVKSGARQTVSLLPERQNLGTVFQGTTVEASVGAIVPTAAVQGNSFTVDLPECVIVTKTESVPVFGPPNFGRSRVAVQFNVATGKVGEFEGDIKIAYGAVEFAIPVEFTVIENRDDIPRVLFVSSPFHWSAGESHTLRQLTSSGRAAFDFRESLIDGGDPSPEFLSEYDVIVLQSLQLIHAGTNESLVKLLQDYVNNGGRLVVLANSFMAGTVHAANEIARPFGLTIDSPEIDDPNARDQRRLACRDVQIEPDVLTAGIDEVTCFRANPIVVTDPALAKHLVLSPVRSRDGVVSVARTGQGELVLLTQTVLSMFFGDAEVVSNIVGDVGDNRRLFENLLFAPKPVANAK